MTYDEIMKQIRDGLTGDSKIDMQYLQEQCEIYKDHELSQEIIRACGRIMYDIIPEDSKAEIEKIMRKQELDIDSTLDEVRFACYKKDYKRALELMEQLAKEADEQPMYKDDSVSCYFNFNEFFEEILYGEINDIEKEIRKADFPFNSIYTNYGALLIEMGDLEKANEVLAKALKWNPVNMYTRTEYMETLKCLNRLEEYYMYAIESFQYAFKKEDLARCYRNLGYYFVEKEMYSEAMGCYLISLDFDNNNKGAAQSELYYIQSKAPNVKEPEVEEFREIAEEHGFPVGPAEIVLKVAFSYGKHFLDNKIFDGAKYCFEIFADLTGDEKIKEMLEHLSKLEV